MYVSSLPLTVAIFLDKLRHVLLLHRAFEPARARTPTARCTHAQTIRNVDTDGMDTGDGRVAALIVGRFFR